MNMRRGKPGRSTILKARVTSCVECCRKIAINGNEASHWDEKGCESRPPGHSFKSLSQYKNTASNFFTTLQGILLIQELVFSVCRLKRFPFVKRKIYKCICSEI